MEKVQTIIINCLIYLVKVYKIIVSPVLGNSCRFEPTCSSYCIDALEQRGIIVGLWLTIIRLGKCHPFANGGYDPVGIKKHKKEV